METCPKIGENEFDMNPLIAEEMNRQIGMEFNAAFLYLSFSVLMNEYGMRGAGRWLRAHFHEECGHALKILDHMEQRRTEVRIPQISTDSYPWETPADIFRVALDHEKLVTHSIHHLLTLCRREEDYAGELLMMDFVREQLEEECLVSDILHALERCGRDESALLQVDVKLDALAAG